MAETIELTVKLDDKASRQLKNIDDAIKKLDGRFGNLNTSSVAAGTGLGNLASRAGAAKIGIAAVGVAAVATTRAILESARAYENIVNQLRLVTQGTDDYNKTIGRLQTLSKQNRTSFGATVELYTKLRVATEDLGYSTDQVEQLTTKLSQALAVAGADAGTANGVIRQFGQAMASGVVRGDEFNSIVEGLGPALNIMARESGINVGQLREMAQNGELTAEVFSNMLLNSNALGESFNKLAPTMDQVDTALGDSLTNLGAAIDRYFGLSEAVKAVKMEAAELANDIAGALAPKTDLEILQEQAKNAQAEIDRLKTSILTMGTGLGLGSSQDLMSGLGAFMNPDATETELKRAQTIARVGSMPNDAIVLNQALKDQEALLNNLQTRIDALQAAKKRDVIASIAQAEAAEQKRLADEAEAARIAALDEIYKKYAYSRTEAAKRQAELAAAQALQNAELEKLLANNVSSLTAEQQANLLYKEKRATIAALNEQLKTNTTLTTAQKEQIRQTIAGLTEEKNMYADLAKNSGPMYLSIIRKQEEAMNDNATQREELLRLIAHQTQLLNSETFNTEENRRKLELLNEALDENAAARRTLLGLPMTLDMLQGEVTKTIELSDANKKLYEDLVATGAGEEQLAAARRILGIATERQTTSTRDNRSEYEKYADALKDTAGAQKKELGFLKQMQGEYDKLKLKVGQFSQEEQKVYDLIQERIKGIEEAGKGPVFDVIDNLRDRLGQLAVSTADTFTDVILGLKDGFTALQDIALQVLRTIISTLIEAQIRKMILGQGIGMSGATGGGALGGLLGSLGGLGASTLIPGFGLLAGVGMLLGGLFADGGNTARAGQKPILVGERGPEIFMPGKAGTVIANEELNAMGGQGDLNVSFTINAIDTQTGVEFLLENKRVITGVIQEAYMRRGTSGPLG